MSQKISFISFLMAAIIFISEKTFAVVNDNLLYPPIDDKRFCESAIEFKRAYEFFSAEKELDFNEPRSIKAAIEVSKNCTGSFERFKKVFLLLKKSGVDLVKAYEVSLEYSSFDDERAKNFFVLFQKLFLENYLNLDFTTAYRLANNLSKDYKGDPIKLRDDFVKIVDFCTTEKEFALDKKTCTQLALELTKYTELFPKGVYDDFLDLTRYVRNHKRLGLNIKDTLNLSQRVIAKGPKAPVNFKKIISYTLDENHLSLTEMQAFQLALVIADLSLNPKEMKETKNNLK